MRPWPCWQGGRGQPRSHYAVGKTTEKLHAIWSRTKGGQPLSDNEAEVFTITANGTRVRFDRIDPVPLTVEIKTGSRMILDYLLSPLLRLHQETLCERVSVLL
jgi:hypothetical protein